MIPERNRKTKAWIGASASRLAKGAIALLPAGAPSKIYNLAIKIPVARDILGAAVRSAIPEKIESDGCTIFLDRSDIAVSGALALKGFETFETELFKQALKPGMNFVDIGAHIGYYSLIASKIVGSSGKVFSLEPEPGNFSLLKKNVEANGAMNITPINAAVSDTAGKRDLFIERYNKGHHSFGQNQGSAGKITVATETLDGVLEKHGNPRIDAIKIDIEGAEPIALRGMKATIARNPHIVIFTEVYPRCMEKLGESPKRYLEELTKLGLSLWSIDEEKEAVEKIADIDDFLSDFPRGEAFKNVIAAKA